MTRLDRRAIRDAAQVWQARPSRVLGIVLHGRRSTLDFVSNEASLGLSSPAAMM